MPPNAPEPPGTPTRRTTTKDDPAFATRLDFLCKDWDLGLDIKKRTTDDHGEPTLDCKCVGLLQFSHHKKMFDRVVNEFDKEARVLYQGWVNKPKADRGTIPPATRRQRRPVNETERDILLQCLYKISKDYQNAWQRTSGGTPKSILEKIRDSQFDVAPVSTPKIIAPSPRRMDSEKRPRDESFADIPVTKKTRIPDLPPQRSLSDMAPPRGRPLRQESYPEKSSGRKASASVSRSANTSFAESEASEVFSQNGDNFVATQETIPDDVPEIRDAFTTLQEDKYISSHYESSSFEARVGDILEDEMIEDSDHLRAPSPVEEGLSQDLLDFGIDKGSSTTSPTSYSPSSQHHQESTGKPVAEAQFRERLKKIFPVIPKCLSAARLCVIYEVTRVFLHADVSLSELNAPITPALEDYDTLWKFLRSLPCLQDRSFPERSNREAWNCALENYEKGFLSVVFGGSLTFRAEEDDDAFFRLKLEPLKLEFSHRLGRRFGHDRFFEVLMPQLSGRHVPTALEKLGRRGPQIIIKWLVETSHSLVGWNWKPFMVKDKEQRKQKQLILKKDVESVDTSFRIFLFAVDGPKFVKKDRLITHPDPRLRPKMSIATLLDCVRPLNARNEGQPFLKFFNRTTLALSRNSPTIVLKPEQIRLVDKDITFSLDPNKEDPKNVMNDGCGKISPNLALKITQKLGLSYLPTAFQGRIGEAKGLWVVDRYEKGGNDWIETYPSQRKWERGEGNSAEWNDPSHLTFEVLKCSGPLKSADLNLQFLPLLMDRAKNPQRMKRALSDILKQGLALKVEEIVNAMDDPQSFRKFVRDNNPNLKERLKGGIAFKAGLPVVREERLNIFLDAGFDPRKLMFMKIMAKAAFKSKTDELKEKLNITVGRSTYAYMVPDFWGVLEADEVYIDFSSFIDNVSGFSGATLSGDEILVARSPAHFVSDIQKVKAVIKAELVGLKDVIVFSAKGKPSLADKLSGGDFDGDIAWVCWEPSIVDNFESAEVPAAYDLVKEGLLKQDKTTYKQLVSEIDGKEARVSAFLRKSFEFNMRQNLLGICTSFKERVCYTQGSVNTWQSRYLSQLLSNLVDQQKQGYMFEEDDWTRFKAGVLKGIKARTPLYKTDELVPNADHIIDNLKYVATKTVDEALLSFHESFPDPPYWDDDLPKFFYKFADLARGDSVWTKLLDDLKADITELHVAWAAKFKGKNKSPSTRNPNSREDDESIPDFTEFCGNLYERFREIQPHDDTHASQSLLMTSGSNSELSNWELLKASAAVASAVKFRVPNLPRKVYMSTFVWWMAGKQLCHLKAMCNSEAPHSVIQKMYIIQKPDATIIRRLRSEGMAVNLEDTASIANENDLDAVDDD
ncbi:related to RNA-dependent RNA polymerase (involved in quelling) [Rhynchosporium agropyri]|uniref:RNA-dependent RNA polymerase n=1 Tax=Rhynchosporium agropyri TaxID=914238 RepID=A0A1E1L780_9HELO|nr:related to RNA-dependent RNA polymerase (involved in quelling) [Rhynchosporium agropyri]